MKKAKLYLILLSFRFLAHFLLRGLTWAVLRVWTQNHPQVVDTCPGHHPQPIAQNRFFKIERPGPPSICPGPRSKFQIFTGGPKFYNYFMRKYLKMQNIMQRTKTRSQLVYKGHQGPFRGLLRVQDHLLVIKPSI